MIKIIELKKNFFISSKTINALKGINLEINSGETVAVCGPSGAGKSTLLHILGLMEQPTSGTIKLLNNRIDVLDEKMESEFRNKYIGFLFQFHYLISDFTVLENLLLPIWIKNGYEYDKMKKNMHALLCSFGIESLADRYPNEISGGEQQRVALARALVNEPKLILADEPTGNLDSKNSELVLELLFSEVKKRNVILIIATHNMGLAKRTNRIIYLKDGLVNNEIINEMR